VDFSGQAAVIAYHTRHLAVACKHYTAALQTLVATRGVIVFVVKRFIHNFNYMIVCWLSLCHVEYAVGLASLPQDLEATVGCSGE